MGEREGRIVCMNSTVCLRSPRNAHLPCLDTGESDHLSFLQQPINVKPRGIALTDVKPPNLVATVFLDNIFEVLVDADALLEAVGERLRIRAPRGAENGIAVVHASSVGVAYLQFPEVVDALHVEVVIRTGVSGTFATADQTDSVCMPQCRVLGDVYHDLLLSV